MKKNNKIAVLGGGLWGTVLAQQLGRRAGAVRLWEFFPEAAESLRRTRRHPHIPGFRLDAAVQVTSDLAEAAAQAGLLLFVLPSQFVRRTAAALRPLLGAHGPLILNASKGIEPGSLQTMGEVIASELPRARAVYTLSGPSFAREVARGVPTQVVLAGPRGGRASALRRLLAGGALRVELSPDRKGVEMGGSLKNVLAVGCGILDGLGVGANTKAALLVQGMAEMGELIRRCGGQARTIYGLSGLGDLIATGTSPESRNRAFGEKLGRGLDPARARREIATVVEGVEAAESARALARRQGVRAPLLEAVWGAVHGGARPGAVLKALGF